MSTNKPASDASLDSRWQTVRPSAGCNAGPAVGQKLQQNVGSDGASGVNPQKATASTKSIVQETAEVPRFLIMKKIDGTDFSKVSPFLIHKTMYGLIGEIKMLKKIKDGLLVETVSNAQSNRLLKTERFADMPVVVIPHGTLNISKGVIFCRDLLNCSLVEIEENLRDKGVTEVKRIQRRIEDKLVDTPNLILTFNTPKLPKYIDAAMYRLQVRPYIPAPLRCSRCLRFGHIALKCSNEPRCTCGKATHEGKPCETPYKCINCEGSHSTKDSKCPMYLQEVAIQKLKVTEKLSYAEAKRKVIINTPTPGISYAKAVESPAKSAGESAIIKELLPQLTQVMNSLMNDFVKKYIGSNASSSIIQNSERIEPNVPGISDFVEPPLKKSSQIHTGNTSDSSYSITKEKRKANSPADVSEDTDVSLSSSQTQRKTTKKRKPGWQKGRSRKTAVAEEVDNYIASSSQTNSAGSSQQKSSRNSESHSEMAIGVETL